jgi:WD40 repeat protein
MSQTRSVPGVTAALLATCYVAMAGMLIAGNEERRPKLPDDVANAEDEPLPKGAVARLGTTRLWKHEIQTYCVAISPNGREVVAGCDGVLRRWEISSGKVLPRLLDGESTIVSVAYFPDGKRVAVYTEAGIHLVDTATADKLRFISVRGSAHPPLPLAISADGTRLAAKDVKKNILIWDPEDGKLLQTIPEAVLGGALAFSPDGKLLASGSSAFGEDTAISLVEISSGRVIAKLDGHKNEVVALAFSADGKRLYSAGAADKTARIWDVAERTQLQVIKTSCAALALSPKGDVIATCDGGSRVSVWDAGTGKLLREIAAAAGSRWRALAFSPSGKLLASAGYDPCIGLWDTQTGKDALPLQGHRHAVLAVAFSPDSKLLASQGGDQSVCLWRMPKGTPVRTYRSKTGLSYVQITPNSPIPPFALSFSPHGPLLASAPFMGTPDHSTTRIWNVATDHEQGEWNDYHEPARTGANVYANPTSVVFTGDGKAFATASGLGIRLRSLADGKELRLYDPENGQLVNMQYKLAVPWTGPLVGIASRYPEWARLLDYTTGRVVREFKMQGDNTLTGNAIALSPDSRLLAAGEGQTIVLWDVVTGDRLGVIRELGTGHWAYAFSHNGRLLASASAEKSAVKVWDVFTRKEVASFEGHEAPPTCVAFSPDGGLLASGSKDTTILLWDVRKLDTAPPAESRDTAELDKLWDELSARDAGRGWRAANALIGTRDQAVGLLKDRLKPAPELDAKRVQKVLADLDADDPQVRDAASAELARVADRAEPLLREALDGKPSAEVRARLQRLLAGISPLPTGPAQGRDDRALYVLEQINTEKAREHLERLAGGAAGARLTRDAKAALERLKRQEAARKVAARAGE